MVSGSSKCGRYEVTAKQQPVNHSLYIMHIWLECACMGDHMYDLCICVSGYDTGGFSHHKTTSGISGVFLVFCMLFLVLFHLLFLLLFLFLFLFLFLHAKRLLCSFFSVPSVPIPLFLCSLFLCPKKNSVPCSG